VIERDRVNFALQTGIERYEDRLDRLRTELGCVPLASDRIQDGLGLQSLLLAQLVDGALHVGDRLGQIVVNGLGLGDEFACHVRGLNDLLGRKTTPGQTKPLNFTQSSNGSFQASVRAAAAGGVTLP